MQVGVFQVLEKVSDNAVIIRDELYGEHLIKEPVLIALLHSPALIRLAGVCQHGITGLFGLTPRVTRFEHSVGAFLLVRKVGASVEEQVAALLHDISHTALSHVVDWALSTHPGGESFHEVHKQRYIDTMTQLPQLLREYNFQDLKVLDESQYPLVEMSAPRLCADRLDYALRDIVAFGKLELPVVQRIYSSLRAFPDASSRDRVLVLEDDSLAVQLSRAYLACDRDVWSNRANVDMYRRTGQIIGDMIRQEKITENDLWALSDEQFWELLRKAADPEQLKAINRLESEGIPQEDRLRLPSEAKIRTLDPDVYLEGSQQPLPLSVVRPEWAHERQQYIVNRERERAYTT